MSMDSWLTISLKPAEMIFKCFRLQAYQPRTFEAIMSIMKILTALFIIYVSFGEAFPVSKLVTLS